MKISSKLKHSLTRGFPFIERAGIELLALERGYVKMLMPIEGNNNHVGTMYAGALFTLAEIPGGAVCFSTFDMKNYYPIVKDMQIKFKAPAKTDITVEIFISEEEAERYMAAAETIGKVDYVLEGELKDAEGNIVALSSGIYQLRKIGS